VVEIVESEIFIVKDPLLPGLITNSSEVPVGVGPVGDGPDVAAGDKGTQV